MKNNFKSKKITCPSCGGSGKMDEYNYDGNNYKYPTGKRCACDTCNGKGTCIEEVEEFTLSDDVYNKSYERWKNEDESLRSLVNDKSKSLKNGWNDNSHSSLCYHEEMLREHQKNKPKKTFYQYRIKPK